MASVEEKVEEYYKALLDKLGVRHYAKTEGINDSIAEALKNADSKSGNKGNNYPDIRLLLENKYRRNIPVMIEAKGSKGKLEKLTKDGSIELESGGKNKFNAVVNFAVNGALHYGNAILAEGSYTEVIIIGVNGTIIGDDGVLSDPELKAYYVSKKNNGIPKEIKNFDFVQVTDDNLEDFYALLDTLNLTEEELENLKRNKEELLENSVKKIHQKLFDDAEIKNLLSTNDKLYFFCGLIMAGLTTEGIRALEPNDMYSNDSTEDNDGQIVLSRTRAFLSKKECSRDKIDMVVGYLKPVFTKHNLWKPRRGESIIKSVYKQIKEEILPLLESNIRLDFTGKILNSLNDWVSIDNDHRNDVVLTPRFVTNLMARIARTNKDSFVWDTCMGSSGFLVSAIDIMIADAKETINDKKKLEEKIEKIHKRQLLGIEILGNIYILAVLNMILMGDGSSQIVCGDSHNEIKNYSDFPANVFLLNPPYSAVGKGLIFVHEALSRMEKGYGAVLIQENAGSGQGDIYAKKLLEKNTLLASIHMPIDLFNGKSYVQTAIYLFKVNRPHEKDDIVTFIDFSTDGYSRQNRKKSTQEVNLRNTDCALERYDEVCAICLGKKPQTNFYTEANGLVIKDVISLKGDDWTFMQHKKIDTTPTEADFKKTVSEYLAWKVSNILKGEENSLGKNPPRSAKLNNVEWGEFRIGDLFNHIEQGRRLKKEDQLQGNIPFVMSGATNTGLVNYISNPVAYFPKNSITVDIFGNTFYRDYEFGAGDDTGVYWNDEQNYSEKTMLFFTAAIRLSLKGRFSYGKKLRSSQSLDLKISLPVKNGKIDFEFMESYIAELEMERIAELEMERIAELDAYLKVTGLDDYELSEEDREVLSFKPKFKAFRLGDVFEHLPVKKAKKSEVRNKPTKEFCVPVVYAKFGDNGIMYWGRKDEFAVYENVISIVYNGIISAGRVYAQEEPTGILAESYLIRYKNEEVPFLANLYMSRVIEHKIYPLYSRENLAIWNNRVENENISLPVTADNTPDFDYMERYIRAMEKIVIENVVKFKDKTIEATKAAINQ